jgi:hypothetical protein
LSEYTDQFRPPDRGVRVPVTHTAICEECGAISDPYDTKWNADQAGRDHVLSHVHQEDADAGRPPHN